LSSSPHGSFTGQVLEKRYREQDVDAFHSRFTGPNSVSAGMK
jgi:hypothetical protein